MPGVHLGVLSCLDGYMNIALEQTEEYVNGRVINRYGDAFIRGNNGALFRPPSTRILYLTFDPLRSQCSIFRPQKPYDYSQS